ncbi:DNA-3-methyladenine glycosylase I [Haliea alexandrii]|uniref:DNA-3-methyladenine glycosylase I n=1 Tax=Haliea alexandrii TaxID=2448162 RepID=UPI000F0B25BE
MGTMNRCGWCGSDPLYVAYHDEEWGVPVRHDPTLFEFLVLEGAQAGLSWITVLRKRQGYHASFAGLDPNKVATFSDAELDKALLNPGIVRNRLKVYSARKNARAFLEVQASAGSFSKYLWQHVDNKPITNQWHTLAEVPARTTLSDTISKDLKRRGFSFVGSTIIYAYMQAVGLVNDHLVSCFRHQACAEPEQGRP